MSSLFPCVRPLQSHKQYPVKLEICIFRYLCVGVCMCGGCWSSYHCQWIFHPYALCGPAVDSAYQLTSADSWRLTPGITEYVHYSGNFLLSLQIVACMWHWSLKMLFPVESNLQKLNDFAYSCCRNYLPVEF